ncbi:MAG TPA: DUF4397 domain-containing protein [Firmicutes bacterium]|nr:DUF4397 domain-containing protein [Bacillota bacterium]
MRYPTQSEPLPMPEDSLAFIRLFHALASDPEIIVDVYINGRLVAERLRYESFTHYLPARPGNYTITLYESGSDAAGEKLLEVSFPLQAEEVVTAAIVGSPDEPGIQVISDFEQDTEDDMAAMRFMNLSDTDTPVSIYVDQKPVVYDLAYGEITTFLPFAPGRHTMTVQDSTTGQTLVTHPALTLKQDNFYTVYGVGRIDGRPGFEVLIPLEGISYLS